MMIIQICFLISAVLASSPAQTPSGNILERQAILVREGRTSIPDLLTQYEEMIRQEPGNPLGYVLAASVHSREASKGLYEKAIQIAPDYAPARIGLARFLVEREDYSGALTQLQKALALTPEDPTVRIEAINAAVRASNLPEARLIAGMNSDSRLEIVSSLVDASRFDDARATLKEFGMDQDVSGQVLTVKGRLQYLAAQAKGTQEQRDQGIHQWLDGWKKSPELMIHYRFVYPRRSLVYTLTQARRTEERKAVIDKGIELYPREYPLYEERWKTQFADPKSDYTAERKSVRAAVDALLKTQPASPELLRTAAAGYQMAEEAGLVESTNKRLLSEFPYSMGGLWLRRIQASQAKDPRERLALIAKYNRDFVNIPMYGEYFETLDQLNVSNAELLSGAQTFIDKVPYPHAVVAVAEVFFRRKIYFEQLRQWMDKLNDSSKPPADAGRARVAAMQGKLLVLQGRPTEAETVLRPLIELTSQGYGNVDKGRARLYLAEAIEADKRPEEAMEMYAQAFAQSQHYFAEAGTRFRALYKQLKGSESGMESYIEARDGMFEASEGNTMSRGSKINQPAPDFSLLSLTGDRVTLASLQGKVVILNFWATWCGPCIRELPHLQEFHDKTRNDPGVAVLAVTTDENRALVAPFIRKNKYNFPVLFDEGLKTKLGVRGIPTTFVIDPSGTIQLRMVSFNPNEPLVPYLEKLVTQYRTKQGDAGK